MSTRIFSQHYGRTTPFKYHNNLSLINVLHWLYHFEILVNANPFAAERIFVGHARIPNSGRLLGSICDEAGELRYGRWVFCRCYGWVSVGGRVKSDVFRGMAVAQFIDAGRKANRRLGVLLIDKK